MLLDSIPRCIPACAVTLPLNFRRSLAGKAPYPGALPLNFGRHWPESRPILGLGPKL
jgi:hypothetical protein